MGSMPTLMYMCVCTPCDCPSSVSTRRTKLEERLRCTDVLGVAVPSCSSSSSAPSLVTFRTR